jgi:hypothetical protein
MTRRWSIRSAVAAWLIAGTWAMWPRETLSHNPITTTVHFNREIVALLQRKCLQCHRDGGMAMSLGTYAEARPWAVAIKEEVLARQMPPWPAETGYGQFANDGGLTTREMDFLLSWVEGGAPEGPETPPPFIDHSGHWMLGQPQTTITPQQGMTVEANSPPRVARLVFDPGLTRETWVRAIDFHAGDRRVARAAFFSILETGEYLGGWTPWQSSTELPESIAFRLPPRARIAVDVLYRGAAETVVDTPSLALYTTATPPTRRASSVVLRAAADGKDAHRLHGRLTLPRATTLFALRPEMQQGGASYEVTALRPDGSREILVRVKRFRFEWQTPFVFRDPVSLPAGSVLEATAEYEVRGTPAAPAFSLHVTQYDDVPTSVPLMTAHQHDHGSVSAPSASADRSVDQAVAPQDSGDGETAWFCPMHPDVTAAEAGQCRKCGMTLVAGRPFDTRDYRLAMNIEPRVVKAGAPMRMHFDVRHPSTGSAVRNFELVHDRRYHLFVVSHDMQAFQHVHPEQQADGRWALDVTLPKPGAYRVISDFLPTGGAPQLLARTLVTADFAGDLRSQDARLDVDTAWKKTVGTLTVELTFDPPRLVAGQYGHLAFKLSDASGGEPVTDLQPYLGAFGHAFVLSEDLRDSVHSHPPEWRDGREITSGFGGPDVMFEGYMPRPGKYRVWAQFLRRGELITIPFTFEVFTLDEVFGRR